jgi:hypothetical protein
MKFGSRSKKSYQVGSGGFSSRGQDFKRIAVQEEKSIQVFPPKESSRYMKIEEKSVEVKTSGIGHGSR